MPAGDCRTVGHRMLEVSSRRLYWNGNGFFVRSNIFFFLVFVSTPGMMGMS
jgi:hypothetical protein